MLNKTCNNELTKNQMIQFVMNSPEHKWIHQNSYLKLNVESFLERMPHRVLSKVFFQDSTVFVESSSKRSGNGGDLHQNMINLYPELVSQLTKINGAWAKAVLAHEIGHVYLDHKFSNDQMETLVDADEFACEMGYLDEIEEYLHEQEDSVEKRVRLTFITTYYFAKHGIADN